MTNANDPVNVIVHPASGECESSGLTKREYFAAMAMQGFLTTYSGTLTDPSTINVAKKAVEYTDALIEQLNKQP